MTTKSCPLHPGDGCLKEACTWWSGRACSVRRIARELHDLVEVLGLIAYRLEQLTRGLDVRQEATYER